MSHQNENNVVHIGNASKPAVVFQLWNDEAGIFFEKEIYATHRLIQMAVDKASTWRELEALLPPGEFEGFDCWWCNGGEHIYQDGEQTRFIEPRELDEFWRILGEKYVIRPDEPYDGNLIGVADGDYPAWLSRTAEDILPREFVERFATGVGGMVSGCWNEYPVSQLTDMVDFLRDSGFVVMAHLSYDTSWWRQIDLAS